MAKLVFKNRDLLPLVKHMRAASKFSVGWSQAVKAYEKATKKKYNFPDNIPAEYHYGTTPTIVLVKDSGIYLMAGCKFETIPADGSHVAYAVGYNADAPQVWERSRALVGGDDFAETIPINDDMLKGIEEKGCDMHINLTARSISITLLLPRPKVKA